MNKFYKINVSLTLKGPLMTSGGGDAARGLNRIFYRNSEGEFVLQGSHVKGKLREALNELNRAQNFIETWFGVETGNDQNKKGDFNPRRGKLKFEDFTLQQSTDLKLDGRYTRVTIDSQTGTSKENFLQSVEALFPSGSDSVWNGEIGFFATEAEAKTLIEELTLALKWITAFGGIKGSGYGRLEKVVTSLEVDNNLAIKQTLNPKDNEITLILEFRDDLQIGVVARSTNYRETQKIIPGAVIKGSLAKFLNELCDEPDLIKPIDQENVRVCKTFETLARNFSNLCITHAFPAPPHSEYRPVTIPFSAVEVTAEMNPYRDVALCEQIILDKSRHAPKFQIDWKDSESLKSDFGWAKCETIHKTRTAINPQTRTADEKKLYTFQYVTPYSVDQKPVSTDTAVNNRPKIRWIARIRFPELEASELKTMIHQFERAVHAGWRYMGKRNARFAFELKSEPVSDSMQKYRDSFIFEKLAIITLQTDALLFDGRRLVDDDLINHEDYLRKTYEAYWKQVFGESCTLLRFFARQKLAGGYLVKRFNSEPNQKYYPYVLTEAGSVFVLSAKDEKTAKGILEKLEKQGLPLPDDITEKIKKKKKEPWLVCPFVPENGYGEIAVNLSWHWEKFLQDHS